MRYFHCPTTFRAKPYGCGAGPYNGTVAFLDMGSQCHCGKALKPYKPPVAPRAFPISASRCSVTSIIDDKPYCNAPVVSGGYCARHSYLNVSAR